MELSSLSKSSVHEMQVATISPSHLCCLRATLRIPSTSSSTSFLTSPPIEYPDRIRGKQSATTPPSSLPLQSHSYPRKSTDSSSIPVLDNPERSGSGSLCSYELVLSLIPRHRRHLNAEHQADPDDAHHALQLQPNSYWLHVTSSCPACVARAH